MNYQVYGNELYHHGILGQKWGVRRYQNPDGSLTPAGRERYRKEYARLIMLDKNMHTDTLPSTNKINKYINDYNKKYYEDEFNKSYEKMLRSIGEKGLDQVEESIIEDGKRYAESRAKEAKASAEAINKRIDEIDAELMEKYKDYDISKLLNDNEYWREDPERAYNDTYTNTYNRYLDRNLLKKEK